MPSWLKKCNICGGPFAQGETRQPHPNANSIGYGKCHKRCAAGLTSKEQEAAAQIVMLSRRDSPEDFPSDPVISIKGLVDEMHHASRTGPSQLGDTRAAPEPAPPMEPAPASPVYEAQYENAPAEATEGQATEDAAMQAIEDAEVADIEKKEAKDAKKSKGGKHR